MNYISAIVIDFGSTNSGCARIGLENNSATYQQPVFLHGSQFYAKDDTWFFVKPDFWQRVKTGYDSLRDSDFRVRSRALPYTENPNIVWGRQHIRAMADTIENEGWIGFKYFKMKLYNHEDVQAGGETVPIRDVVRLFFRILKVECLDFERGRHNREVTSDEIQWGITIPSIWGDSERALMTGVSMEVLGPHVRVLSEPEGPILAGLVHSNANGTFALRKGRVTLVSDMGGGTTDLTLVEEVSEDPTAEYPIRTIAATDGLGMGGNNIDDAFWNYILRYLSRGKTKDDENVRYDDLSDQELREMLLTPYMSRLSEFIDMENAWLDYKHGNKRSIQFPPSYRKWLQANGHGQIAGVLTDLLTGEQEIDTDDLHEQVLMPTYNAICQKVKSFLEENRDKLPADASLCVVTKAGGLSLSGELRNLIDRQVSDLGIRFTSSSLAADPVQTSGNIMDGACIVLLNRKVINRFSPCHIFYDMVLVDLFQLCDHYKSLGIKLTVGDLNSQMERESAAGLYDGQWAIPVAIKGHYFKDHRSPFVPTCEGQETIMFTFYGSDETFVVMPKDNPDCYELGSVSFDARKYLHYELVLDFNESPINNNFHYFIYSQTNGELIAENNIPIATNSKVSSHP